MYKARWHGKAVAVKQIKSSFFGSAIDLKGLQKETEEFQREIAQMAALPYNENVVQLHGTTMLDSGELAAVVEYCSAGSLSDALYGEKSKRREFDDDELIRLAHDAACGVLHLHRNDIVHRDVSCCFASSISHLFDLTFTY